jgi:hypothetical protein
MSISERTIYPSENYIEKLSDHIIFNRRINIQDFHNFNRSHIHDILELLSKWLSVHD